MSSVQIRMDGNGTTSVNEWMSGAERGVRSRVGWGGDERNGEGNEQTDTDNNTMANGEMTTQ